MRGFLTNLRRAQTDLRLPLARFLRVSPHTAEACLTPAYRVASEHPAQLDISIVLSTRLPCGAYEYCVKILIAGIPSRGYMRATLMRGLNRSRAARERAAASSRAWNGFCSATMARSSPPHARSAVRLLDGRVGGRP